MVGADGLLRLRSVHCAHRLRRPRYFRLAFACSQTNSSLVRVVIFPP